MQQERITAKVSSPHIYLCVVRILITTNQGNQPLPQFKTQLLTNQVYFPCADSYILSIEYTRATPKLCPLCRDQDLLFSGKDKATGLDHLQRNQHLCCKVNRHTQGKYMEGQ